MSQENVEVIRRLNDALNAGDETTLGKALDRTLAPDAELRDLANAPDQADVLRGREAIEAALGLWTAAFEELRADIEESEDREEFVICAVRWHGRAKETGLALDMRMFDLWEVRDGVIVSGTMGFRSKAEALEAAGLSE